MRGNYKPLGKYIQPVTGRNNALGDLPLVGLSIQTVSYFLQFSKQQTASVKSDSKKEIGQTLSDQSKNLIWRRAFAKLSWSHFERLIRVENEKARNYYLVEAAEQNWGVRTLYRNISTLYYQRLISSQKKELVQQEMEEKTAEFAHNPDDFIRNPAVLDFLKLPTNKAYTEQELEQALIDNLQQFLLELGKGFSFVARQKHIRTETADFYIDLVFYNYILAEQLTNMIWEVHKEFSSGDELGIDFEEKAFFDILMELCVRYEFTYPEDKMIVLAKAVKDLVDSQAKFPDWNKRDDIKSALKVGLILLLDEFGYPPVERDEVYVEIFEQAENFKKNRG